MRAEEEDVELMCEPGGKPKPTVTWSINGVPADGTLIYFTTCCCILMWQNAGHFHDIEGN